MIAHSANPYTGKELMTMSLVYPRFVHSEFMTHRVFSRNAMSSRAVPVQKMIDQVRNDPAMPIHWGSNKPGMQAGEELTGGDLITSKHLWKKAAEEAANSAQHMMTLGLHKQVVNRILEPFQWMHTIVSATEWENFFDLRISDMAEPNMRQLAQCMKMCIDLSVPAETEYHVPYVSDEEIRNNPIGYVMMLSAARCARASYLNHDGSAPDAVKDYALAKMLKESRHASPFEHQAEALGTDDQSRNFIGWEQQRAMMYL